MKVIFKQNMMQRLLVAVVLLCGCFFASGCTVSATTTDKWDGSVDTSWFEPGQKTYDITSAAQLAGLAQLVDDGETFKGATVNLRTNVDLNGKDWNPIGGDPAAAEGTFYGNFNGNNNSIVGLHIVSPLGCQALFGSVSSGTLENFAVKGDVKGRESAAGVVSQANSENLKNIVTDVDVFSTNYFLNVDTAGLVGHYFADAPGTTFVIQDCANNGAIDANDWNVAGLVGSIGLSDGTAIKVSGCSNSGYVAVDAASKELDQTVAGLVAELGEIGTYTIENCKNSAEISGTDVVGVSGIVGVVRGSDTTIIDCENSGKISTGTLNEKSVAAGIVAGSFASQGYSVKNCKNTGELVTYNGNTIDLAAGWTS